jgi:hypothetical protein
MEAKGKMRKFAYAPLAVMLSVVPQIYAGEAGDDLMSSRYFKMPFGEHYVADQKSAYGFASPRTSDSSGTLSDNQLPPLLNLQFNGEELDAINLNGFNVLERRVIHNTNGNETTVLGVNWKYVAAGALVAGGVAWPCHESDWDVFGYAGEDDPPTPPPAPPPA